ncbi:MAG: leucine--tRNA ligase, partial [Planctomycetota bacterium]|nr:leucine--tRNA ligase [Planctomycetota bacterium]
QWMLRITAYSDRLLEGLDELDWPESIKIMQRNWIGRSEGADVDFVVAGGTAFQAVSNEEFSRIASIDSPPRPQLTARTFEGCDPYPPGQPSTPDLMKSIRNLPHVIVPGATYFVTFRAKNTTFAEKERDIIFNAMLHWHAARCVVYAAVVLEDHAHMILRPLEEHTLSEILQSIKGFSSREINKYRKAGEHIWQDESFDHIIRDSTWLTRFIYYICDNPEERRLTDRFDQYRWLFVNSEEVETEEGKPFGHSLKGCATQGEDIIRVYTTRPDTLFGATYMVLAPEHPLVEQIIPDTWPVNIHDAWKGATPTDCAPWDSPKEAVRAYVEEASHKSELERTAETKQKTGVFTGAYAINPVNGEKIPIWVADYVMMGYGTGAIMAVPAHDTRDLEFAEQFGLPIIQVVAPPEGIDWRGYVGDGIAVNSGQYDGLSTAKFKKRITEWLEEQGLGQAAVNYKLRDWLFSRQRYWGEPFPIVHCDNCGTVALPEDQLPLELPEMNDFTPSASDNPDAPPAPPLAKATDWVNTTCPACGGPAKRETNTMPQWAGSCWYYLRFLDPKNDKIFCDPDIENYWMARSLPVAASGYTIENQKSKIKNAPGGVDLYVGGAEHAVLHLLYARFWHKVLYDLGCVSTPEPFSKLFNQGMIRSYAYRDRRGVYIGYDDVDISGEKPVRKSTGEVLAETVEKMSKSLKNVVNPDKVIAEYGADTFRLYEMFMGPLEASKPWNTRDVPGVHRFCRRVWRMICGEEETQSLLTDKAGDEKVERALHKLIKKVGSDIEAMKFNTAIAAMMEFVNVVFKTGVISKTQAGRFVLVLAPLAPHLAEELWQQLGHERSLAHESWPVYNESLLVKATVELAVQVNGRMRGRITVPADAGEDDIITTALDEPKVAEAVEGKTVVRKIVVPGRLVNLVVK